MTTGNIGHYNSVIAENVKKIIAERGLKQTAIAVKAGFTVNDFNAMLNGRKIMKAIDIQAIALALGTDANTLFGYPSKEAV